MVQDRLLIAPEVSAEFRISKPRLYELTRRGVVPVVRLGPRQLRWSARALGEFVASGGLREESGPTGSAHDTASCPK